MACMEALTLIIATAAITALLTWFFTGRKQVARTLGYGTLAPVWREGYLAGVADERTASAWATEYGPNRNNPYPGDEMRAQHA